MSIIRIATLPIRIVTTLCGLGPRRYARRHARHVRLAHKYAGLDAAYNGCNCADHQVVIIQQQATAPVVETLPEYECEEDSHDVFGNEKKLKVIV